MYPSEDGKGYCRTPGLVGPDQVAGWRRVTDAVHAEGGRIVMQVMHVGRIAVAANKAPDAETVAPSAVPARAKLYADVDGGSMHPCDPPRALDGDEITAVMQRTLDGLAAENPHPVRHRLRRLLPALT